MRIRYIQPRVVPVSRTNAAQNSEHNRTLREANVIGVASLETLQFL